MSRLDRPVLHLARFTLEAKTALSIGSGGSDGVYDHPIVRDANGLPAIPGTSLAGVLRHLWVADHGSTKADLLFGYQHRDDGAASRLEVAACALQDSHGRPVEGLLLGKRGRQRLGRLGDDILLSAAFATRDDPLFRDRVRLSHRGTATKSGKFDRGLIAAGYRFNGELRLWSRTKTDRDWPLLLALLCDPRLRLGGATRAGMGAVQLVSLHAESFDLRDTADAAVFRGLGRDIGDTEALSRVADPKSGGTRVNTFTITLTPRDFWRMGQGNVSVGSYKKSPDLLPKMEPVVTWANGRATIGARLALVPGSSVKGALAHRTAFHWNALNGIFVDDMSPEQIQAWDKSEHCDGVRALFGYAKESETARGHGHDVAGRSGHLLIDDTHIAVSQEDVQVMIHNSLDRFTGGVRNRMLFTEELIWKRPIELKLMLLPEAEAVDSTAKRALARAILDLCQGRLALGAGTTKGHGSFAGTPDEATKQWVREQGEEWV